MGLQTPITTAATPIAPPSTRAEPPSVTLGVYLAAVAGAVRAGLPQRSWIEATVVAAKPGPHGHSLQLVDPAGGASAPTMRAFLGRADGETIASRLGAPLDPQHLVGLTAVLLVEPEFHPRWGLGGRVVGLSHTLRESLIRRVSEEVRARLKAERLYDRQKRLPAPADVVLVAVVHPPGAAGHADIAAELARWERAGLVKAMSVTTPFEGLAGATGIVAALRRAASGDGAGIPDVILIVRGGGDRAGLLALDDEDVVRAVCHCPVPIVTGLGHATDQSLVDEVAWDSCHTPSKALARLAGLIVAPARRAELDMSAILTEADRRATAAGHVLEAARRVVLGSAQHCVAALAAALLAAGLGVEAVRAGTGERCAPLEAEAKQSLEGVLERASRRSDEAGRIAERVLADLLLAGRRCFERADDGRASIGFVSTRAGTLCNAAAVDLEHLMEAVPITARTLAERSVSECGGLFDIVRRRAGDRTDRADDAARRLAAATAAAADIRRVQEAATERLRQAIETAVSRRIEAATADLASISAALDAADPAEVLRLGYALVLDRHDRPITSAAATKAASTFTLCFTDGTVVAKLVTVNRDSGETP